MRRNYVWGRSLEYQVKGELELHGYWCMRSASSHGLVDVLALRSCEILLVQAKRNGRLDPAEWNQLYTLACENDGKALLVTKKDGGRGNRYWLLTGMKIPHKSAPCEVWTPQPSGQGLLLETRSPRRKG